MLAARSVWWLAGIVAGALVADVGDGVVDEPWPPRTERQARRRGPRAGSGGFIAAFPSGGWQRWRQRSNSGQFGGTQCAAGPLRRRLHRGPSWRDRAPSLDATLERFFADPGVVCGGGPLVGAAVAVRIAPSRPIGLCGLSGMRCPVASRSVMSWLSLGGPAVAGGAGK